VQLESVWRADDIRRKALPEITQEKNDFVTLKHLFAGPKGTTVKTAKTALFVCVCVCVCVCAYVCLYRPYVPEYL